MTPNAAAVEGVERFHTHVVEAHSEGAWVRFSDFDSMAARNVRLREALREADPHGDADLVAIRALADAALNRPSLLGYQKEAIASLLQQYARFMRVARKALAGTP